MQVHMLADPHGELARALGVELDTSGLLGNKRGKRYASIWFTVRVRSDTVGH